MSTAPAVEQGARSLRRPRPITAAPSHSVAFDWWIALVSCAMVFGLFIDGWAHNHGMVDDSFFTPWHALLYGAFGVAALSLIAMHFRNVSKGHHWKRAMPPGYTLALYGALVFAVAGSGDMLWHEAFGIETGLESLLSPTHLILAGSGLMIVTAPARAMWLRRSKQDWNSLLPAILSITAFAAVFNFFLVFAAVTGRLSVLTGPRPLEHEFIDSLGVLALLIHSNVLLGVTLFVRRRWRLPFGAFTLIYAVNGLGITWLHVAGNEEFLFVISAGLTGFAADWLLLRDDSLSTARIRLTACVLPALFGLATMLALQILSTSAWANGGLWWEIHMWLGAPVMAGALGYGLSLLAHPPAARIQEPD